MNDEGARGTTPEGPSGKAPKSFTSSIHPREVVALLLLVLALIFVFQNPGRTRIHFLAWHGNAPAWVWIICVFVAGVIVGTLLSWYRRRATEREQRSGVPRRGKRADKG